MIFYKRFIGDIQAKTGHLSLAEFGAYDRLLDHCYSTEGALPTDIDTCCRIARAVSSAEKKAVASVLAQFFIKEDGGYVQPRVQEMLADAAPKINAAKENGKRGGRPKKPKTETQQEPNGFQNRNPTGTQDGTQQEPNGFQNRNPTGTQDGTQQEPNGKASQSQNIREEDKSETVIEVGVEERGVWGENRDPPGDAPVAAAGAATRPPAPPTAGEPDPKPAKPRRAAPPPCPDGVPEHVWRDFAALRRAKRAPLTATALEGIRREADKAGIGLGEALACCCEAGWQGFRADWYARRTTAAASPSGSPGGGLSAKDAMKIAAAKAIFGDSGPAFPAHPAHAGGEVVDV